MRDHRNKTKEQLLIDIEVLKAENGVLKKNKDYSQIIAENAVDFIAIITFDLKAKYVYVSPSILKASGYELEEMLGKSSLDFIHPKDRGVLLILIKKYISLKLKSAFQKSDSQITETIEFRFKNKDGSWSYLQNNISFIGKNVLAISRDITEQKQIEKLLINSEVQFKSIFSEAPVGIEIYDSGGSLVDANRESLKIFGVKDLIDIKGFNLFKDPNLSSQSKTMIKQGKPVQYETEFDFELIKKHNLYKTSKSGKCFLNISITPCKILELNDIGYLAHIKDITERKQEKNRILESEEKFRSLFNEHSAVKLILDPVSGNIKDANKAATKLYGWSVEELKEMNISQINTLSPEEIKIEMELARASKKGYFEFKHKKANGITIDVEVYSNSINIDGKDYLHSIIHDITKRKKAEIELIESENKYRTFFENNDAIILFVNPDNGEIKFSNEAAAKFYGYSRERLIGLNISNIHTLTPEEIKVKMVYARRRKQNYFLFKHKLANGEIRDVEVYQSKLFIDNQDIFSIIVHDITDRIKAEEELKESE
ncbi:MAG: PAS domain S-box protein, partial [Draconibacterium sp.]|nr:PAS domain S-box protein [Draconibacterium sp.]